MRPRHRRALLLALIALWCGCGGEASWQNHPHHAPDHASDQGSSLWPDPGRPDQELQDQGSRDQRQTPDLQAPAPDACAGRPDGPTCAPEAAAGGLGRLLECRGQRVLQETLCPSWCHTAEDGLGRCADDGVDPCFDDEDGVYCGAEIGAAAAETLYACQGRRTAQVTACASWCDRQAPSSRCADNSVDPCFDDADGVYCGHFIGATSAPQALHTCRDRRTAQVTACASWCHVQDADDACANNAIDACFDDADGVYCGHFIGATSAPQALHTCQDRRTAATQGCPHGCEVSGAAHRCKEAPRACLDRPPGTITRGFSACGRGGSHYGIDYGAALGTVIPAGMSGQVVAVATGHPNCPYNVSTGTCPSSCINQFNYVKLKVDGGDPGRAGHDLYVYYLHVDRLGPGIGQGTRVSRGQTVAYVGNSGCSSGPHIHLETVSVPAGQAAYLARCASSFDPAQVICP